MKPTKNGYDFYEVLSALQKDIRRGNEEQALHWAFELLETNSFMLRKRLRTIIYEDIGVADQSACIFSLMALEDLKEDIQNKGDATLILTNIVLALCRADKTRDAGNLSAALISRRQKEKIAVPDYAIDMHTLRGKQMGRGIDYFFKEGAKCSNDHSNPEYAKRASQLKWFPKLEPNSLMVAKGQKRLFKDEREKIRGEWQE